MTLPASARIVEVGPRDGLQNEPDVVPVAAKIAYIDALAASGLGEIEATSFVNPKVIPQLADAEEVLAGIARRAGVVYSALAPNERGLNRAIEAKVERIAVFTAASDAFTEHNIRMTVEQSLSTFRPVVERAIAAGMTVRGYVSTAVECPYAGKIEPQRVAEVAAALSEMGCDEVALGETIGVAGPADIDSLITAVAGLVPRERLALHLHDTSGTALANVHEGLRSGITTFDASAGGLGGCPYAPGAAGNLATEDLVYFLDRIGIETGVDLEAVVSASRGIAAALGRTTLPSKVYQRLAARCS